MYNPFKYIKNGILSNFTIILPNVEVFVEGLSIN